MIVYDVTNESSFQCMDKLKKLIEKNREKREVQYWLDLVVLCHKYCLPCLVPHYCWRPEARVDDAIPYLTMQLDCHSCRPFSIIWVTLCIVSVHKKHNTVQYCFYRAMLCISTVLAVRRCLSIRPSRSCIVSIWLKVWSHIFLSLVAPPF